MDFHIRPGELSDAEGVREIYADIVENTAISFEIDVPDVDEMAQRIENVSKSHVFLVAEHASQILGYAYGSFFRPRKAYEKSAEVTVYVHKDMHGKGIGRRLYEALFEVLAEKGFHTALAGIALPNDASVALHKSLGFTTVGVFREVGFKFDKWHDVEWWQRPLGIQQKEHV
ncbi:MAG: arsinothricin resistance N-acetyltransferase ArsN1 family B [Pseudomonadota bacterium]